MQIFAYRLTQIAIQIFADDIAIPAAHQGRERLIQLASHLRQVLHMILVNIDLEESFPKRNHFFVDATRRDVAELKRH